MSNESPATAEVLAEFLRAEESRVTERWAALLRQAQPALFGEMDAQVWASRYVDTMSALQVALAEPERLRYPVFSRSSGLPVLLALGERAVAVHTRQDLDLHEFLGAYFLLQQAIVDTVRLGAFGDREAEAFMLVDHFIKQLAVAIAMAVTARQGLVSDPSV